ncbi:MAG: Hsp70 family protein [Pseudomonadota bacterium]
MTECFGIDLGTTNSVIARLTDGKPLPIAIDGSPIVPSVVLFQDDRIVVGREARNLELLYPERAVHSSKRKMGQAHQYQVGNRTVVPEEVAAQVLRTLAAGAGETIGEPVRDVVITVPAYFDDAQRRATLRAGELAELNVLRLLNEPTSAALVYDQVGAAMLGDRPEIVLVYDLGGGTFDVSVLEVFKGVREVRAIAGNTALGGDDFDEQLVRFFLTELRRNKAVDPTDDPRAMARLRRLAEDTKIRLSSATSVRVREDFLTSQNGTTINLDVEVTRRQFEEMIDPYLRDAMALTHKAVADARLGDQPIDRICLVGGSTRIPMVRALLEDEYKVVVHEEVDPDLAVGLGAAVQAGLLQGVPIERILVDVAAHTLGVKSLGPSDEHFADTFAPVLRRNTVLPASRVEEFYTLVENQKEVDVEVFQGEAARASQNQRVGAFAFKLESRPANSPVSIEFSYDLNGVVKVSASQPNIGNSKTVALRVADAGAGAQETAAVPDGVLERRARALLERLEGSAKKELSVLLVELAAAKGENREDVEERLLDFFMEHDSASEDEDEDGDGDEGKGKGKCEGDEV